MNHTIQAIALNLQLAQALLARGLHQGKAFRQRCVKRTTAAQYVDLEALHAEVAATSPRTWADIADEERAATHLG